MIAAKILLFLLTNALIMRTEQRILTSKKEKEQEMLQEMEDFSKIHEEGLGKKEQEPKSIQIFEAIRSGELKIDVWNENSNLDIKDSAEYQQFKKYLTGIKIPKDVAELSKSLKFEYWTLQKDDSNKSFGYIINFDEEEDIKYVWKKDKPLVVITHGWLAGHNESGLFSIKKAYVLNYINEYNILTLDWGHISAPLNYFGVAKRCIDVGTVLSHFLIKLVTMGLINPTKIHMVGHSLGAHVLGACGSSFYQLTKKKIARITGLDPSGPAFSGSWYYWGKGNKRLDKEDANFVDVIHTARGITGLSKRIGHVDFYPNNGMSPQPGCGRFLPISEALSCSHQRAYVYYHESVINPNAFPSLECKSMKRFKKGKCVGNETNQMGLNIDPNKHGTFFLNTKEASPFSREIEVIEVKKKKNPFFFWTG